MMQTAPTAVDILDFQFKLQCRLKVFDSKSIPVSHKQCNLVAVASRYGLLFVGSNDSLFQVIKLQQIQKYNSKEEVGDYCRRNIILNSIPQHISVNCDCSKLCVVMKDDCVKAIIYDLASFLKENISIVQEVRLSSSSDVDVLELVWNPTVASLYAVSKSDGSLAVHDVKETAIDINELPKTTGAICMCWSPKGKQLAIGSNDGKITQYKPDLKIAKVIDSPLLEGPQFPIALQWISNYQFIAVYRSNKDDSQSSLIVINTPKGGGITYINYEDICYSYGNVRPHQFYIHFQNAWNIVLVASSNSMEVGVLGFEKDIWTQWILADAARAELPLNDAKQETFPVGLALDTSSSQSLPWGETTIPPTPLLLLLSDNGVLCCFHVINLKEGAVPICRSAEVLYNASVLPFSETSSESIKQPNKSVQPTTIKQNVTALPVTNNTFTFAFDQAGKPIANNNSAQLPGIQKNLFSTPIVNADNTTNTHINFNSLKSGGSSVSNSFIPSSSDTKHQSENAQHKIQPLQQSNLSERNLLADNKFIDAKPRTPTEANEDTESFMTQMVKEEYTILELEFKTFIDQNKNIKVRLGTDKEATNLVQTSNNLQEFLKEINDICQTHTTEIHLLKQTLIQNWAWYEEARSRFITSKDPSLITLVRAQSLDTASTKQLEEIHHLLYYLESQLTHANTALDEQWEMFQNSCKKKINLKLPNIEAIYQSMVKQSATIQKQTYMLRDISNRLKTNTRLRSTPHLLIPVDVDKVEEKLEHLRLQTDPKDIFQIQYKTVFERQRQLTNTKNKKLIELLKSRRLNHVCVTKPQLMKKTLHFNGLMNTSLSPIPPKKELQPHRINFIQSAPRMLDEPNNSQNNEEFEKQQAHSNIITNENVVNIDPELSQNANKFNLITTKSNLATSCAIPVLQNNSFVYGEVKTSPGSAFVPTTQNMFNIKSSSVMDTTVAAKPKNNFSFSNSMSAATNINASISNRKDASDVIPTSAMTPSIVDSAVKINFNYPIFASAKMESGTTADNYNLNTKAITSTTSILNSSTTSTFKSFNSAPTSHPTFLSTTITPVTIIPKASNDEMAATKNSMTPNTPLMFSTKPFEIPVISSTKVSSTLPSLTSTGVRTTTPKEILAKSVPSGVNIAAPVTILQNIPNQSENHQSMSSTPSTLSTFPTSPLLNKIVASTSVSGSSQSVSTVTSTLNASLDLTTKNKAKSPTNAIFPANVANELAKSTSASEFKPTTESATAVQSCCVTTLQSIHHPSPTFTFNSLSTGSIFSGFQFPSTTFSPQTVQPTFRHTSPATSLFDNSETAFTTTTSNSLFNTSPITTSTPDFGISVPVFGISSIATSTTTTTSTVFATNNITATTTMSTFSAATALNSTQDSTFPSNASTQPAMFGVNTTSTTKPQASVFQTSTNSSIFGGTANMTGTSGSLFGVTSTGSLFSTPKNTSTNVFGSSSTNFTAVNSSPSNFFTPSTSTTPIFGQAATFGSTSIFSSPANTNAGNIFGSTPAGVTNAFDTTTATTNTTPFGTAFGSNSNSNNMFGSSNDSFRFSTTTGTSTSSGNFGFGNKSVFTTFGNSSSSTDTTHSFGNLILTTTANTFGNGFSQNPFNRVSNTEQKSPFSGGSLFGSPITTSSTNMFGGTSPFNKATPAFGGPATFGSSPVFGQQSPTFGQSSFGNNSNMFGQSPQLTTFSGNNSTVNHSGFGASPVFGSTSTFGSTTPGGFGAPPNFGSPTFGSNSTFNTSSKPFSNTFGSTTQQNHTFANLANQQTLGFGSLAQQNQTPTSQAPFSGGSSFSTWR